MNVQQLAGLVSESGDRRTHLVKAHLAGRDRVQDSNASRAVDQAERLFSAAGALEPPWPPEVLSSLLEQSNGLRQCVDAYVTNIEGFGHDLIPIFDVDADDVDEKIREAMFMDRLRKRDDLEAAGQQEAADAVVLWPTDEELVAQKLVIIQSMRIEKVRLKHFLEYASLEESFVSLRRKTRQDVEVLGNGFWEIRRNFDCRKNPLGEIAHFTYVPGFSIRILPLDRQWVTVNAKIKASPLSWDHVPVRRQFRRYVQILENAQVYFKEFGDPRPISRSTGRPCERIGPDGQPIWDEGDGPATELMHFKVHSPRSAYGVPRWIGVLLEVLGSRSAAEVNYLYFENKSVPPMALLVSGGGVTEQTVKYIEDYLEHEIKGKANFHKLLVLEAEPAGGEPNGRVKIDLRPLTAAQHNDALFQQYDERNLDKIGEAFRLPRMLRGNMRDFNRATADAALYFAESQVFEPEREKVDFQLNRFVLVDMGVRYWQVRSKAPVLRDPLELAPIIIQAAEKGLLIPEEARHELSLIFNHEFKKIRAAWLQKPINLTLAELQTGANPFAAAPANGVRAAAPAPAPAAPAAAPAKPAAPAEPAPADAPPTDQPLAASALNGAQVTSALQIVQEVAAGNLPRESALAMLQSFFQLTAAAADGILGPVGKDFAPAEGGGEAPPAGPPGPAGKADLSSADLAAAGAIYRPAYRPPPRRRRRDEEDDDVMGKARELLALRDRVAAAEAEVAREAFLQGKLAEKAKADAARAKRKAKKP